MTNLEQIIKLIAGEDVGEIKPQTQMEAVLLAVAERVAGSSPFVPVHLTYASGAWTADVSFADAKAAALAGKTVVFVKGGDMVAASYSSASDKLTGEYATGGGGYMSLVSIELSSSGLNVTEIVQQVLPTVTAEDAGASLTVNETGEWVTTPAAQAGEE